MKYRAFAASIQFRCIVSAFGPAAFSLAISAEAHQRTLLSRPLFHARCSATVPSWRQQQYIHYLFISQNGGAHQFTSACSSRSALQHARTTGSTDSIRARVVTDPSRRKAKRRCVRFIFSMLASVIRAAGDDS